jgi:peptide/nickel transport system permease protein
MVNVPLLNTRKNDKLTESEKLYAASQWQLMWRKFKDHKLAMLAAYTLIVLYTIALLAPFLAPYDPWDNSKNVYAPPMTVRFRHEGEFMRPFVYGIKIVVDAQTFSRVFSEDTTQIYPIRFFVRGAEYKWLGLITTDRHLFGIDNSGDTRIFLLGADSLGRDFLSRCIWASQISLTIGLVGVFITFVMGCIIGGLSGYYGGLIDNILQRFMEFVTSVPTLPMWMALSATIPLTWSPVQMYFVITVILALRSWTGLSRVVRSKLLQLREEDFVLAAKVAGTTDWKIIQNHLLPSFASVLIVHLTIAIPGMILGETALSFLGLGLRPPTVSWGVLLQDAQNIGSIAIHTWLMAPAILVIVTVLAFNFVGDGLRDAADPYHD